MNKGLSNARDRFSRKREWLKESVKRGEKGHKNKKLIFNDFYKKKRDFVQLYKC